MSYLVIARKYRPQTFGDVVGQKHVTQTLENAIAESRVAHAYIFSGARGVGKTTTARILAKALNCVNGPTATPCNVCDACKEITAGTSLDVMEIDAASNRGIDQIRELREMVRYAAAGGRHRVVILDEAHMLTDEASNALLKTLEEPPDKVIFVMATTEPEALADTIRSRSQHFHFRALSFAEITDAIEKVAAEEKLKIDAGAVSVMARAAEGSLRDGLSLLEQAIAYCGKKISDAQVRELLGVVPEESLDELVDAIEKGSSEQALGLVDRLMKDGRNLQHFCREAIRHFRNLLVARVAGADSELIAAQADERPRLKEQSARFGEEDLTRFFQILLHTDDDLRRKPDPRLHMEMGLLRLVNAARLAPFEDVIARMSSEGAPGSGGAGPAGGGARPGGAQEPLRKAAPAGQSSAAAEFAPVMARENLSVTNAATAAASVRPVVEATAAVVPKANGETQKVNGGPAMAEEMPVAEAEAAFDNPLLTAIRAGIRQHKMLDSLVELASRWELEGNELRLFFPAENRSMAEILQGREPMEKLRTLAQQATGQTLRVCVKLESTGRPARAAAASAPQHGPASGLKAEFEQDPMVRAVLERFGGQIAEVKRGTGGKEN